MIIDVIYCHSHQEKVPKPCRSLKCTVTGTFKSNVVLFLKCSMAPHCDPPQLSVEGMVGSGSQQCNDFAISGSGLLGAKPLLETMLTYCQCDGLVEQRHNSSALAMEFLLSCINLSNWTLRNKLQRNFDWNTNYSIEGNAFENVVFKITIIWFRPQFDMKWEQIHWCHMSVSAKQTWAWTNDYRKVSNIRRTLLGNKIVDHSDVVGASPVGAAPTTSSFST